ncbi:2433_t:CDS:1 [Dentiscutata erythropus]|uniref:2433_t:CDS:1 n=1 Tax=Dentiscutata erythropus TaxID=1348616 RepID=A0A9N9NID5_9GLOM|nr:2433_t:CDS:1 [Dentiscutata erythropus]
MSEFRKSTGPKQMSKIIQTKSFTNSYKQLEYFLEIDGALKVGSLRNQPVFECRLCNALTPSNIKEVSQHIIDFHKLDDNLYSIFFVTKVNRLTRLESAIF